jgi:anti-sigma factor RsiW
MANEPVHDLTPAYALDALDEREREAYEEHLAQCEDCQRELATFSDAASSLAYVVDASPPPRELRARILERATAERSNVVPLHRRRAFQALAAVAAVAAAVALGFGIWNASLHSQLGDERAAVADLRAAAAVLGDARGQRIPMGQNASVIVTPSGAAALVANRLPAAPGGKTYEIWVIRNGKPAPAGLFRGGHGVDVVRLDRPVPRQSLVAVTIEPKRGSEAPTSAPLMRAQA